MTEINYEKIFNSTVERIGYISGSNKVLFIKGGQGGSVFGDENRYLKLALFAREKYGCSVFVAETHEDSRHVYDHEMKLVFENVSGDPEIYYLGVSKGGLIGIWYAQYNPRIKKLASINAPLMINFHNKTRPALKKLNAADVTMIYGSRDASYNFVPFIKDNAIVKLLDGADHNLKNSPIGFTELIDEVLLCRMED